RSQRSCRSSSPEAATPRSRRVAAARRAPSPTNARRSTASSESAPATSSPARSCAPSSRAVAPRTRRAPPEPSSTFRTRRPPGPAQRLPEVQVTPEHHEERGLEDVIPAVGRVEDLPVDHAGALVAPAQRREDLAHPHAQRPELDDPLLGFHRQVKRALEPSLGRLEGRVAVGEERAYPQPTQGSDPAADAEVHPRALL